MKILILSGPVGAGKSTISKLYAQQKPKCVFIETDDIRHMVVSPRKAPWEGEEGIRQLELGVNNACLLTEKFIEAGFDVIIADFITDRTLPLYKDLLKEYSPFIVQLFPSFDEAKRRFDPRSVKITDSEFKMLYDMQAKFTDADLIIDNTSLSPQEVIEKLISL